MVKMFVILGYNDLKDKKCFMLLHNRELGQ